jgi:hypothetical protein
MTARWRQAERRPREWSRRVSGLGGDRSRVVFAERWAWPTLTRCSACVAVTDPPAPPDVRRVSPVAAAGGQARKAAG